MKISPLRPSLPSCLSRMSLLAELYLQILLCMEYFVYEESQELRRHIRGVMNHKSSLSVTQ